MSIAKEKEKSRFVEQPRSKTAGRWRITLAILAALAMAGVAVNRIQHAQQANVPKPVPSATPIATAINALGRIEPEGEVIALAPPSSASGARIDQLLVKEGQRVKVGQVVAVLDNNTRAAATLEQAKGDVLVARANLAKVKAGAQTGEIEAQKATIARLEAQLQGQKETLQATVARTQAEQSNAKLDFARYEKLFADGAISAQQLEASRLRGQTTTQQVNENQATLRETIATLERQIEEAKATLNKISEVRPTDVQVATAEVEKAMGTLRQAEADLKLSKVKAPKTGEIIKIHSWAGETVGSDGIAELGRTEQMIVVAEVSEDDIGRVRPGQRATVTSENRAFDGEIRGTVKEVGRQVGKQNILDSDPAADVDARVVEVRVALTPEDSQRVSGLTYGRVIVEIHI